jgi:hypothetical protein
MLLIWCGGSILLFEISLYGSVSLEGVNNEFYTSSLLNSLSYQNKLFINCL